MEKPCFQDISSTKINHDEIKILMKLIINLNDIIRHDIANHILKNVLLKISNNNIAKYSHILRTDINYDFLSETIATNELIEKKVNIQNSDCPYIDGFSIRIIPINNHITAAKFILNGYNFLNHVLNEIIKLDLFQTRNHSILLGIIAVDKINSEILTQIERHENLLSITEFKRVPRGMTLRARAGPRVLWLGHNLCPSERMQ